AAHRLPPARGHAGDGHRIALREQPSVLDERELELPSLLVEPAPVGVRDRVVEDDLRPGATDVAEGLAAAQLRVDRDDLHRSSSATATAASPSPRPVKPSPSVVVARTVTSPGGTLSASASRACIAPRRGAMRGCSPTRTQSALPSFQPASRTCA